MHIMSDCLRLILFKKEKKYFFSFKRFSKREERKRDELGSIGIENLFFQFSASSWDLWEYGVGWVAWITNDRWYQTITLMPWSSNYKNQLCENKRIPSFLIL